MPVNRPLEPLPSPARRLRRSFDTRRPIGVAAIEIAISAVLMIIVSGLALDVTLLLLAITTNDSACRDACRAAANQNTVTNAVNAAQSMLKIHATDGFFISQPKLVSTAPPYFVYQNYNGQPPSTMSPYVTVTTKVRARMPLPLNYFGVTMNGNHSFLFKRQYTFPVVKTALKI